MIDPNNVPNKEVGEETKLFLRRHWVNVLQMAVYSVVLFAVPIIAIVVLRANGIELFADLFWGPVSAVILAAYLFIVVAVIQTMFTDYYLDTWIVTTERIINIEQQGLFSRVIAELHLNQIQDVTAETHGIWATFLSFGDVYIQTAGTRERFNFKGINNPEQVKETILNLVKDDKRRHGDASQVTSMAEAYEESREAKK